MDSGEGDFSPDQYVEMISGEWQMIAPMAYRQFLKAGRGAVYIDFRNITAGMGEAVPVAAFAFADDLRHLEPRIDESTRQLLSSYDPERTVVFLLERRSNVLTTMFLSGGTRLKGPKELFDEQNRRPVH